MEKSLKNKAAKGVFWSACDKFGVMALQFGVNLILARLLTPDDFGLIGLLYIFIAVTLTLIDGGFGSALIQKKKTTEIDYATILYWNIGTSILLYLLLFFCAPFISEYYQIPLLTKVIRVIGLTIVFNSTISLQINRLQKQFMFNQIAKTNIISYALSAAIAILLAIKGFGVWSLVFMSLLQPLFRSLLVYFIVRWWPKGFFSFESFRTLVSFGGFLLISNLLENISKNLQGLIIGRNFSAEQMGYYTQADKLDQIASTSIPQVIATVMYPVFSQFQDDKVRLVEIIKMNFRIVSFIIYPILVLLIIIANHLIEFLYGIQWKPSAVYFQILCCGGFCYSVNSISYYAVAACGKSKALLKLSFYKWSMFALLLTIGLQFGMNGIMWAMSLSYVNIFFANCFLAKRYSQIKFRAILLSLFVPFVLSIIIGIIIYLFNLVICENIVIVSLLYIFLYILCAFSFKVKAFQEIKVILSKLLNHN